MGVSFEQAHAQLDDAVDTLFDSDPRVQEVGIGRDGHGFGYGVVRNTARIVPLSTNVVQPHAIGGVPVRYFDAGHDVETMHEVPASGTGSPGVSSFVPEQGRHRHVVCGLQIQNWDDDDRRGILPQVISIGTLGCFVTDSSGDEALLSNNHVIAGHNAGQIGDRITQPGGAQAGSDVIATLSRFVTLNPSPAGARPAQGTVVWNESDAAYAIVDASIVTVQGYLPARGRPNLSGTAQPRVGDRVFKVGRTSGLTWGQITRVGATVGPIGYRPGDMWFRRVFVVEGENNTLFSDRGDSGSIIAKDTGEAVGLLFAGNGTQTYASPIDTVLSALNVTLP